MAIGPVPPFISTQPQFQERATRDIWKSVSVSGPIITTPGNGTPAPIGGALINEHDASIKALASLMPGLQTSILQALKSYYPSSDRNYFEQQLSAAGAVGNGGTAYPSDDAYAIQNAIRACYSYTRGRISTLNFPPGIVWYLNSVVGDHTRSSLISSTVLDLACSVSLDGHDSVFLNGPVAGAAHCNLLIHGDPLWPNNDFGMMRARLKDLQFSGVNTYFSSANVVLDDNGVGGFNGPGRYGFEHVYFNSSGQSNIQIYNNAFNTYALRCEFNAWGNGYAVGTGGGLANSGESITWDACQFYDAASGSGGVCLATYADWNFTNCNFDYNGQNVIDLRNSTARVTITGSHFEFASNSTGHVTPGCSLITMNNASYSQFHLIGGTILLNYNGSATNQTGTTPNTLPNTNSYALGSICNSGTRTVNPAYLYNESSYGIILDHPYINYINGSSFASCPLNAPGATGRFVYNP